MRHRGVVTLYGEDDASRRRLFAPSQVGLAQVMGIGDLSEVIEPSKCYGLNISDAKPVQNLFMGDERLVCQSAGDRRGHRTSRRLRDALRGLQGGRGDAAGRDVDIPRATERGERPSVTRRPRTSR